MKKVLVVDDELAVADTLSGLLGEEGYEVRTAENGKEALGLMDSDCPDVVVSDVMMPVMDGRELVRRIREDTRFDGIKIVLMSAATGLFGHEPAGEDAFLRKPFSIDDMLDVLRRLSSE